MIRIPRWGPGTKVKVGERVFEPRAWEYFELSRRWDISDVVEVDIPLNSMFVTAHPMIEADWSKVAIVRGPLIYCIEQIDNEGYDINYLVVKPDEANLRERYEHHLLNRVIVVEGNGHILEYGPKDEVYQSYNSKQLRFGKKVTFKAIPYCLWNNRGKTKMYVWFKAITPVSSLS
uniref:Non-reducing end beta-L-arabinofuranosidase-like GH127 C-terminal domain-containing protein n=1 Tax=Ignisphaera aggregans TaxID=334771 RepID=A0A7C5Z6Q6_9CREN